jgi:hypothetical protein
MLHLIVSKADSIKILCIEYLHYQLLGMWNLVFCVATS